MDNLVVFSRIFFTNVNYSNKKSQKLFKTFSVSTIWHSSSLWITFCSLPWQLQSITFIYGQWPWLCYFLKLFLNVINNVQHLIHNVPFFLVPPIPSKKWGIFNIQWCVCIQGYVKLIKLCSFYKSQNAIPNFCLPPIQVSFHENIFYCIKHHNLEANVFVSI